MSLETAITSVLQRSKRPLLARQIARELSEQRGSKVDRRLVNQLLNGVLADQVTQDASYGWSLAAVSDAGETEYTADETVAALLELADATSLDVTAGSAPTVSLEETEFPEDRPRPNRIR